MATLSSSSSSSSARSSSTSIPPGMIITPDELSRYQQKFGDHLRAEVPTLFQTKVLLRLEDELALLGGRGSGKSWVTRAFLLKGNPDKPNYRKLPDGSLQPLLINQSYVYSPDYKALILRRNQADLTEFIKQFAILSRPYGGVWTNGRFEFPASGAYIDIGHLADKDAWQKHIGKEYVRIVLEEAGLIPEFSLYEQILACLRSPNPDLRKQLLLSSNAGGPGMAWLLERFYEAIDNKGEIIPPFTPIIETIPDPYSPDDPSKSLTRSRIFLFSTLRDNPHLNKNPEYRAILASLKDPKLRAAYLEGDWKIFKGSYFGDMFRPTGPTTPSEPPEASHVIPANSPILTTPSSPLYPRPWYPIIGGGDIGYTHESAFYWARLYPSRQHHIYREMVTAQSSYVQIGYELARRSLSELNSLPSHSITFFISHDAFGAGRTGGAAEGKSIAELLAAGAARVLGSNGVHIPDLIIKNLQESARERNEELAEETLNAIRLQRRAGITFRRAIPDRVIGWQYCREALRWTRIGETIPPYSSELSSLLLQSNPADWEVYESLYRNYSPEVLPKLIIHGPAQIAPPPNAAISPNGEGVEIGVANGVGVGMGGGEFSPDPRTSIKLPGTGCPRLIDAIPKARHPDLSRLGSNPEDVDKTHFHGMDSLDAWRYLEISLHEMLIEEPFESFRDRRMEQVFQAQAQSHSASATNSATGGAPDMQSMVMSQRIIEQEWADTHDLWSSLNIPRKSSRRQHQEFSRRIGELSNLSPSPSSSLHPPNSPPKLLTD